jgi:hypothetical protein
VERQKQLRHIQTPSLSVNEVEEKNQGKPLRYMNRNTLFHDLFEIVPKDLVWTRATFFKVQL